MKIRADIAEMLRDGLTDRQIEKRLHVNHTTVAKTRAALGIPKFPGGGRTTCTLAEALLARSEDAGDGHRKWTGQLSRKVPVLRWHGRRTTAYRAGFVAHNRRAPVGVVQPGCGVPWCVAPAHMDDTAARQRNRAAFKALFGGAL
ncbi:hypothetical protein [Streptomyces sp. W1SF4]|uniref:hypothetical protein n=1 Tax=Streptomyces sp. W1SF4 TaxID=2305220 RepID=UPI000F6D7920|nr:hypothetical protein [Streptomyces sp. W1SF4]AZM91464.1 hypothetical protein D1J60_25760 [Streptomyces sp. W1SF4]